MPTSDEAAHFRDHDVLRIPHRETSPLSGGTYCGTNRVTGVGSLRVQVHSMSRVVKGPASQAVKSGRSHRGVPLPPSDEFQRASRRASELCETGSMASSPPSATEFTLSMPQSPFARAGSFLISISGLPAIDFMTRCSSRPLKRMVMACSRDGMGCLAHGLRSLWLLFELAEVEKTPLHSSARILGRTKIA